MLTCPGRILAPELRPNCATALPDTGNAARVTKQIGNRGCVPGRGRPVRAIACERLVKGKEVLRHYAKKNKHLKAKLLLDGRLKSNGGLDTTNSGAAALNYFCISYKSQFVCPGGLIVKTLRRGPSRRDQSYLCYDLNDVSYFQLELVFVLRQVAECRLAPPLADLLSCGDSTGGGGGTTTHQHHPLTCVIISSHTRFRRVSSFSLTYKKPSCPEDRQRLAFDISIRGRSR